MTVPRNKACIDRIKWLMVARCKNIGPIRFRQLWDKYRNIDQILEFIRFNDNFKLGNLEDSKKELENLQKFGGNLVCFDDEDYPELLRQIADGPIVFSYIGDLSLLRQKIIAIVGSRNANANNISFTKKMAYQLGQLGFVVSSGLAYGIDTAAHIGSLKSGTIAVIAGGIDNIYPRENYHLYQQIYQNGLVISEGKFGQKPRATCFPRRNRIICGISLGCFVVEAKIKSGSLITARLALEQNREVFAMPGLPYDPNAQGCNYLIKNGAKLVENVNDIVEEFGDNLFAENQTVEEVSKLTNLENKILEQINYQDTDRQSLLDKMEVPVKDLNVILAELEIKNKIVVFGSKICKKLN